MYMYICELYELNRVVTCLIGWTDIFQHDYFTNELKWALATLRAWKLRSFPLWGC